MTVPASSCVGFDPVCRARESAGSVIGNLAGDVFAQMADAVTEAVGQSVAALGTLWVNVGTPALTTTPGGAQPSDTVGFLQSNLLFLTLSLAVVAVLIGAGRLAWERRGEPLLALLRALITLVVVSGAGLAAVGLLVTAADALAQALIDRSATGGFGDNITAMLVGITAAGSITLTSLLVIVLGGVALVMSLVQILLMVARGGMLVILAAIFPTAAAFTNTQMGNQWFQKCVAWLIAFVLYKPAAAIVYATAFRLTGSDVFTDDGSGIVDVVTGLTLMALALLALPALMRFVTPMVGAMAAGGAGGAAASMALAAAPTGAIAGIKAMANQSSAGGGGSDSGRPEDRPSGSSSSGGPSGGRGGEGPSGSGGTDGPSGTGPTSSKPAGAQGGGEAAKEPAGAGTGPGAGGAGGAGAGGAGAGAGGAGAGAGAGGAGAAGAGAAGGAAAAAGPVGAGVAAAAKTAEVVKQGAQATAGAAKGAAGAATGEGEPDGSSR